MSPIVPGVILAWMVYRTVARDFRWTSAICIPIVAYWFCAALLRYVSDCRSRSANNHRRAIQPLSDTELEERFGHSKLQALSLAAFGGVMATEQVLAGRSPVNIMFRQKPEPSLPFSGWVFLSSEESPETSADERGLNLHDCIAILRVAPEVAPYLDRPPGTHLVRSDAGKFDDDPDENQTA
jgi:hypothetical protein